MQARALVAVSLSVVIMVSFQIYLSKAYKHTRVPVAHIQNNRGSVNGDLDVINGTQTVQSDRTDELTELYYKADSKNIDEFDRVIDSGNSKIGFNRNHPFLSVYMSNKFHFENDGYFLRSGKVGIGSLLSFESSGPIETDPEAETSTELSVVYSSTIDGLEVEKRFEFQNGSCRSRLSVVLRNRSAVTRHTDFRLIGSSGLLSSHETNGGFNSVVVKKRGSLEIIRRRWSELAKKSAIDVAGGFDWAGTHNRYFSVLFRPLWEGATLFIEPISGAHSPVLGVVEHLDIPPGGEISRDFDLYIGPMELSGLELSGFQDVLDFGMFGWISRIILSSMFWIKSLTKSYGVSIVLLTVLLNMLLYPMTFKSFLSMRKIQDIQPQVELLREKHKDDYTKMNKELMGLYKKEKINPLGGCVPMVLQMPIFISLYQALSKSVELWGTPFLAIRDLSRPDRLIDLPFAIPFVGSSVNVLPVLMSVAMFFQQRIMSTGTSSQSQQMMVLFPFFFLAICYQMPSGLIIYWITHTLITVTIQLFITKRMRIPVAASSG